MCTTYLGSAGTGIKVLGTCFASGLMDIMGNRWINLSSSYMAIVTGLQGSSKGSGLACAKIMIRINRV